MFKNLFGGKKKEEPKEQAPVQNQVSQKEAEKLALEKQLHETNLQIQSLEDQQERNFKKMEKLDAEIRELVHNKQKTKAQTKIKEMQDIKKQTDQIDTRKNIFIDMKLKLDTQMMNINSLNVFKGANEIFKQQEKYRDQLEDQLSDWQDYMQQQQQDEQIWNQLSEMTTNKEEINEEFEKYEKEIAQEQANQLNNQLIDIPNANLNNYQIQQQQQQQQKVSYDQQKQQNFNKKIMEDLN